MINCVRFEQTIPILRIFSVEKAEEFYLGYLGFARDWQHRFAPDLPLYMQIARGALVLHLSEHHGDCCPGAGVVIRMEGIEALHRSLDPTYRYLRPGIEPAPWGGLVLRVTDPFGNRLSFSEAAKPASPVEPSSP